MLYFRYILGILHFIQCLPCAMRRAYVIPLDYSYSADREPRARKAQLQPKGPGCAGLGLLMAPGLGRRLVGLSRSVQLCSVFSRAPSRTNEPVTRSCHDCDRDARGQATIGGLCCERASSALQVTRLNVKPGREDARVYILRFAREKAQRDWGRGAFGGADRRQPPGRMLPAPPPDDAVGRSL